MKKYNYVAPCLMGTEKLLSNEIKFMGAENVIAENGRVFFEGDLSLMARANIRSRIAERVLLLTARFEALSFEQLFENVKAVNWSEYLPFNAKFPVTGSCLSSKLRSVSDCQSIIKKAVVESLKNKYKKDIFPETGDEYKIKFLILKDQVTVMLDTSGRPLHKRGYRAKANFAPIKETLAAALCELSGVRSNHIVIDPCCGSGTILIEAAMKALNIAPNLNGNFAAEFWSSVPKEIWDKERQSAKEDIRKDIGFHAYGYDIDDNALEISKQNAQLAGVSEYITFKHRDIADFNEDFEYATIICNPPYGERLLDVAQAEELYRTMGKVFKQQKGYRYTIICPDDDFQRCFGRKADKRRKLYNGTLSCQAYIYL